MIMTTSDIVLAAVGVLAVIGVGISISAWRHAVRMEREMSKDDADGLASTV